MLLLQVAAAAGKLAWQTASAAEGALDTTEGPSTVGCMRCIEAAPALEPLPCALALAAASAFCKSSRTEVLAARGRGHSTEAVWVSAGPACCLAVLLDF